MEILKIIIVSSLLCPGLLLAGEINLRSNDVALINHIKKTDYIFTTALGQCKSEKVLRNGKNFEYVAVCAARAASESDCPEYKVKAKGTIDTESWATVRDIKLVLQCYG